MSTNTETRFKQHANNTKEQQASKHLAGTCECVSGVEGLVGGGRVGAR